jgi:hypothetical protein
VAASRTGYSNAVFLNCPFDREYAGLFEALVFCVMDCGFVPRCALSSPDAAVPRLQRIQRLIETSRYSIHDLSRVELTPVLPRFNMPFELGLDLGCRAYGGAQAKRKRCLILDQERFRYQELLSDIAGQDIRAHHDSHDVLITEVRNWLRAASHRTSVPGPRAIKERFAKFSTALPSLCDGVGLHRDDLEFADYTAVVASWLRSIRRGTKSPPRTAST